MMNNFSEQVWNLTKQIPKGKVTSYSEIAKALGRPKASRAVGQALKRNPYAPHVPCHRVVRSDGGLGGFRGADERDISEKAELLRKEGIIIEKDRIDLERFLHRF
jgi:methylated-DNA-[protein]-cysteine S-methyltransferase